MTKFIYETAVSRDGPAVFEVVSCKGRPDVLYRRLVRDEMQDPKQVAYALNNAYEQGRKDRLAEIKKALEL